MSSSSEDSNSDSGTNFKRGKRKSPEVKISEGRSNSSRLYNNGGDRQERRREPRLPITYRTDNSRVRSPERNRDQHRRHSNDYKRSTDIRYERSKSREKREVRTHNHSRSPDRRKKEEIKKKRSHSLEKVHAPQRRAASPRHSKDLKKDSRHYDSREDPKKMREEKAPKQKDNQGGNRSEPSKHRRSKSPLKPTRERKQSSPPIKEPSSRQHHKPSSNKSEEKSRGSSKNSSEKISRRSSVDDSAYGPALPPPKATESRNYMPALPKVMKNRSSSPRRPIGPIGPTLPKDFVVREAREKFNVISSDDDDQMIGPLPTSGEMSERDLELEKRKIEIKLQQLDRRMQAVTGSDVKQREEWMLELPDVKRIGEGGVTARQFRKNNRPDFSDRTSWTATPNDEHKKPSQKDIKKSEEETRHELEVRRRDEEQEKVAKEHKKSHKRDKTLMEIHEKKLKKEKKKLKEKGEMKPDRRPFNRDTDLSANKFDEARKKSALKKAELLDMKFSSGNKKYL